MFNKCKNLKILDVSNFKTSKVITLEKMSELCGNLVVLDLKNFDTSSVINMDYMFHS